MVRSKFKPNHNTDNMSKLRHWKPFVGLRPRQSPNIPATFMQEHIENDLSPAITAPPLQYTSEISAFAKAEKKKKLLRSVRKAEEADDLTH